MPRYVSEPMPDGCPWSGWAPPNVDWCEEQLCAWVTNPADTWSNLAYLVIAVWMWRAARQDGDRTLAIFAPAAVFVGFASGIYHASYTAFFQFFDFMSMFVFTMVIITVNAVRLGWVTPGRAPLFAIVGAVGSSALVPVVSQTPVPIQAMVFVHIVFIVAQELVILRVRADGDVAVDRRGLWLGLSLITAAAISSVSDVTRTVCDPTNHWIQGHAVWHVLSAASLAAMFAYYRGLPRRD